MKRSPSVAIALIEQCLRQFSILIQKNLMASTVVSLFTGDPDVSEQLLLMSPLLLLQEVSLAQALLRLFYKS